MRSLMRAIAGLATTAVVAVALAGPSDATFAGHNGLIAFATASKSIYTVEPDGSNPKALVSGTASSSPSFSPDGETVVFSTKGSDQAPHLATVDADGGKLKPIAGTKAAYDPSFSASGERIAFSHKGDIVTIDVDGSHPKTVVKRDSLSPSFSPVGARLIYIGETKQNSRNVFIVDANGKHSKQLTSFKHNFAEAPSFSPDGKQIVFSANDSGNDEIWIMDANGSHLKTLTDTRKVDEARPAFSPDGKLIAFDDSDHVFTMDASGVDPVQITDEGSYDNEPAWQSLP